MGKRFFLFIFLLFVAACLAGGCVGVKISLETESKKPLKEVILQGKEAGKVLILPVRGFLSNAPKKDLLRERAGTVQEVVSQLRLAEKDQEIKALLLEINSPGGSITASDILYHEIMAFKKRTNIKIVAALMDVAASGGYYIALPADSITAHPTSITGSVGVIFNNPKVAGLMDKLGLGVEVSKSGQEKDIGSPFRPSTPEEQKIFQELTDKLGRRFLNLVAKHRQMEAKALTNIASARIYLAEEALELKLIDRIGYLDDAISEAKALAGLPQEAKVVVYRRSKFPNDTPYNTAASQYNNPGGPLVDLTLPEILPNLNPGFYYLWMPGTIGH
jgi:protease IV